MAELLWKGGMCEGSRACRLGYARGLQACSVRILCGWGSNVPKVRVQFIQSLQGTLENTSAVQIAVLSRTVAESEVLEAFGIQRSIINPGREQKDWR